MEVEDRVAALLREQAVPLVAVEAVRGALAREPGGAPCEAAALARRLASRPDRFVVLERASPLVGAEDWPTAARAAYEAALREAGWEGGPVVASLPDLLDRNASPACRVGAALAELAAVEGDGGGLRARVQRAMPLAEATMRVLAEAAAKRREYEASAATEQCGCQASTATEQCGCDPLAATERYGCEASTIAGRRGRDTAATQQGCPFDAAAKRQYRGCGAPGDADRSGTAVPGPAAPSG
jgi:hypothetical protein